MAFDPYELDRDYGAPSGVITEAQYTTRTFLWMMLGLMVTFGTAYLGYMTGALIFVFFVPIMPDFGGDADLVIQPIGPD